MLNIASSFHILMSSALPGQIIAAAGAIATLIIAVGIGIWSIRGACKAFRYLTHVDI
jgi:hypothetical protein